MGLSNLSNPLIINRNQCKIGFERNHKYLPGNYEIKTELFSPGDYQTMCWVDYCVRYCSNKNMQDGKRTHFVSRYTNKEKRILYSIVKISQISNDREEDEND